MPRSLLYFGVVISLALASAATPRSSLGQEPPIQWLDCGDFQDGLEIPTGPYVGTYPGCDGLARVLAFELAMAQISDAILTGPAAYIACKFEDCDQPPPPDCNRVGAVDGESTEVTLGVACILGWSVVTIVVAPGNTAGALICEECIEP